MSTVALRAALARPSATLSHTAAPLGYLIGVVCTATALTDLKKQN